MLLLLTVEIFASDAAPSPSNVSRLVTFEFESSRSISELLQCDSVYEEVFGEILKAALQTFPCFQQDLQGSYKLYLIGKWH